MKFDTECLNYKLSDIFMLVQSNIKPNLHEAGNKLSVFINSSSFDLIRLTTIQLFINIENSQQNTKKVSTICKMVLLSRISGFGESLKTAVSSPRLWRHQGPLKRQ